MRDAAGKAFSWKRAGDNLVQGLFSCNNRQAPMPHLCKKCRGGIRSPSIWAPMVCKGVRVIGCGCHMVHLGDGTSHANFSACGTSASFLGSAFQCNTLLQRDLTKTVHHQATQGQGRGPLHINKRVLRIGIKFFNSVCIFSGCRTPIGRIFTFCSESIRRQHRHSQNQSLQTQYGTYTKNVPTLGAELPIDTTSCPSKCEPLPNTTDATTIWLVPC